MSADPKSLLLAVFALAASAVPAAQAAAMPPIDLEIGYADQVAQARNFDLVDTQDHLSGIGFSAAIRPFARWPRLWLELDESYASTSAPLHQTNVAALDANDLGLSVLYRHRLYQALGWYARVGGHLAVANLALQDTSGNTQASQWQAEPGVGGGLGLEVIARPYEWNATDVHDRGVGVRLEAGYIWFPDLQFNDLTAPTPSPKPNPPLISSAPLAMGPISLAGIHVGFTAFLRF